MTKKEFIDAFKDSVSGEMWKYVDSYDYSLGMKEMDEDEIEETAKYLLESLKDILITKKSFMIALNLAYRFGRDNAAGRSEANFNDFTSTSIVQRLLSKTYQNDIISQRVLSKTIEDTVQEIIDKNLRGKDFVSLCEKRGLKPSYIERLMNSGKKY